MMTAVLNLHPSESHKQVPVLLCWYYCCWQLSAALACFWWAACSSHVMYAFYMKKCGMVLERPENDFLGVPRHGLVWGSRVVVGARTRVRKTGSRDTALRRPSPQRDGLPGDRLARQGKQRPAKSVCGIQCVFGFVNRLVACFCYVQGCRIMLLPTRLLLCALAWESELLKRQQHSPQNMPVARKQKQGSRPAVAPCFSQRQFSSMLFVLRVGGGGLAGKAIMALVSCRESGEMKRPTVFVLAALQEKRNGRLAAGCAE